jgi:hypothetical protein
MAVRFHNIQKQACKSVAPGVLEVRCEPLNRHIRRNFGRIAGTRDSPAYAPPPAFLYPETVAFKDGIPLIALAEGTACTSTSRWYLEPKIG